MQVINKKIISDMGTFDFPKILIYELERLPKEFMELRLNLSKIEFKLITMVLALRNDDKLYSGTLKNMCEFLNLGYNSTNKKNLQNAINNLTMKRIIRYDMEGSTFTVRFDLKCSDKDIIKLDRAWLETIKTYKADKKGNEVDWSNLLKVFICLIDNDNEIIDAAAIATQVDLKVSTVKKALIAIKDISSKGGFGCGFTVNRKPLYRKVNINYDLDNIQDTDNLEIIKNCKAVEISKGETYWNCIGSAVSCGYEFK